MRERITTCGEILGAATFATGLWMLAPWLGVTIAGIALVGLSWLAAQ